MKKSYLNDLQSSVLGTVSDTTEVLDHFSTDASILTVRPAAVVYPRNTADVRKVVILAGQRTESGKPLSVTPRGMGTDLSGAALGEGVGLVFPAHMNKILKVDKNTITVQPGANYRQVQQVLQNKGRFLPSFPASIDYSTIGGAVANNAAGEKTLKYGATRKYVRSLKVVLSDGSVITTSKLSNRQLHRKKGQADLEGEIYRKVDSLIIDNRKAITEHTPKTTKNSAGYALGRVRSKGGSFDLGQLLVGSQGTLGVITEITLETVPYNSRTTLLVGYFDDLEKAGEAISRLKRTNPCAIEMVDGNLLGYVRSHRIMDLDSILPEEPPKLVVLIEYDDQSQLQQLIKARRASKLLSKYATSQKLSSDRLEQESLWRLRRSTVAGVWSAEGPKKALPFIEDAVVPPENLAQFLNLTYRLLDKHGLDAAIWGHAGDGNIHLLPLLDLSKKKDIAIIEPLSKEYYEMVGSLGGSTTAQHGDGIVRAPYLKELYDETMYDVLGQVKSAFDPHGILNPLSKIGPVVGNIDGHLRSNYSVASLYDNLPYN